jgi:diguanylate cyclase (GGDEF)-like protein
MNDKNFNSLLLLAILLTIVAILAAKLLPTQQLGLNNNTYNNLVLLSEPLADGSPSAEYTNNDHTHWRCNVPAHFKGNYFACSLGMNLASSPTHGADLSKYSHLNLQLNYKGNANKIRIAIRNYNPAYSTPNDGNSSKFNSVQIHTRELNREVHLALSAFSVSEWWLTAYNIPLKDSLPDMSNAMTVNIDFGEEPMPGPHEFELIKLELEGERISTEHWYLTILSIWMLGIFFFALHRLVQLHKQSQHDSKVINELSVNNQQLQQETNKFRKLSTVDPLTQIYNRFGIDQIVASLTGKGHLNPSSHSSYALLVIDIDHFKHVNDRHGHDTGDKILQQVAKIIHDHLRAGDFAGRWGGEEFIVILPDSLKSFAMELAEKIRTAIFTSHFQIEKPLVISASFGVSQRAPDEDFASCFKRTDKALYKAKQAGRNCCMYAEDN